MNVNTSIICFFLLTLNISCLSAQTNTRTELCKDVYVWDFKDRDGKSSKVLKDMADEVESALTQCTQCTVLERKKFGDISAQISNEIEIQSGKNANDIKNAFGSKVAKVAVFGTFINEEASDEVQLQLRFVSLERTQNLLNISLYLKRNIAFQGSKARSNAIRSFVLSEVLNWTKPTYIEPSKTPLYLWGGGAITGLGGGIIGLVLQSKTKSDWSAYLNQNKYDSEKKYDSYQSKYNGNQVVTTSGSLVFAICTGVLICKINKRNNAKMQQMAALSDAQTLIPKIKKRHIQTQVQAGERFGIVVHF